MERTYDNKEASQIGQFVAGLCEGSKGDSGLTFDSANAQAAVSDAVSGRLGELPEHVSILLDETKSNPLFAKTILDSVEYYEREHGVKPSNDLLAQAMHNAYATTAHAVNEYKLDSVSDTTHHNQMGLVSPRPLIAVLTTIGDAIPFAHYLPSDISTNKAQLIIISNRTADEFGSYDYDASLDGIASGDTYINSARIDQAETADNVSYIGKITAKQGKGGNYDKCDPDGANVKLLRGRSVVYVNGMMCAREVDSKGMGDSAISGKFVRGSNSHTISGKLNTDNGVYALKFDPALGENDRVLVESFIDYERVPELTPSILTATDDYTIYANAWRVSTHQTIDSRTQMSNELGLDPYSQQVITINNQFGNERHYDLLRKAMRIAVNYAYEHEFNLNPADALNTRVGFLKTVAEASQDMLLRTNNFGIGYIYVGKSVAAYLRPLPNDIFQASGIAERAGIYRVGKLFGLYDVYYSPKVVGDNQMLCIGRSTDVARSVFIMGDAVPATVIPLATNKDLKTGAGFYARNFTTQTPYEKSAVGCSLINCKFDASF